MKHFEIVPFSAVGNDIHIHIHAGLISPEVTFKYLMLYSVISIPSVVHMYVISSAYSGINYQLKRIDATWLPSNMRGRVH